MGTTYLITGGAGNLACQLTFELVARGDRIVLFDVADRPVGPVAEGCHYVRGDLTCAEDLSRALREHQPARIVHLASLLSGGCEEDRRRAWQVNMDGTFGLFEAALSAGIEEVFFASSLAAYGGELPEPLPEDFPEWPDGLYGVTKAAGERLGVYYHRRHGLDFRCVRLPAVLSRYAPPGAVSAYGSRAFVEAVQFGRFTFKVRPGTRLAMMYVRDALRAMAGLINAPPDRLTRRVYNVHAIAPSAEEIADAIAARVSPVTIRFDPDPQVVQLIESWPRALEDGSARRDWQWQPAYDLDRLADDFIEELRHELANGPRLRRADPQGPAEP